ncbi:hypothetical protein [Pseudonocardia asaccharolytica]|uniref:Uncharacterized protein n=1 Tax=Pseudonocardia asaccharolytica DSM 44247 = NBRC 16224 TaxID=1123024 RepID=A0A511D6D1_9PSEU|nr:hypothetical protein [Pseudonocardia asaccharolytica]GEL18498.1 hypothetical protein PA7_23350 [Pseudonocardia asaccharolytica DSM 44247 = NBRC 16224]
MTRLDDIPSIAAPPAEARPSAVVARIRSYRPSRRTVLRGLVIAAAASALVPLDWWLSRRGATAAPEGGTASGDRSEFLSCMPESYDEEANNWWSGGPAVCYGGWRRGSYPCSGGYHREGEHSARDERYVSTRLATNCDGRNAWRWHGYRCSDAVTTARWPDGTEYTSLTIAACELPTDAPAEAAPAPEPAQPPKKPVLGGLFG